MSCCKKCSIDRSYKGKDPDCGDDDCPCHQPAQEKCKRCGIKLEGTDKITGECFAKCKQPPQEERWEEELYFTVLEDLIMEAEMRNLCRDPKEYMRRMRDHKSKLVAFIARKIAEAQKSAMDLVIKRAHDICEDEIEAARQAERERILALLPKEKIMPDHECGAIGFCPHYSFTDISNHLSNTLRKAIGEST